MGPKITEFMDMKKSSDPHSSLGDSDPVSWPDSRHSRKRIKAGEARFSLDDDVIARNSVAILTIYKSIAVTIDIFSVLHDWSSFKPINFVVN